MHAIVRILVASSCLGAAGAFAGPAPAPTPAPAATPGGKTISIEFRGTLRDALKAIADKGGINLVITGDLQQPGEFVLKGVSAEEALQIVADSHDLKVRRQGSIWTIRPLTAEERAARATEKVETPAAVPAAPVEAPSAPAAAPAPPTPPVPPSPPSALAAPVPPLPPAPPEVPDAPDAFDRPGANDDLPDPTKDPKGFQRQLEERVQKDLKSKWMKKFRKHSHNDNDVEGHGNLVITEDQTVGDALSYGSLDVLGHVEGDAVAFGGGVHLGPKAEVDGDVVSFGGGITREEGASVGGDEVAFGGGAFGRVVASTLPKIVKDAEHREREKEQKGHSGGGLPGFLISFAVLFGSGFLAMMFVPNRVKLLEAELRRDPVRCGVTGLVSGLALPLLSVLLTITIIGIPVALGLILVSAAGCLMGIAAFANEIGTRLPLKNVRKTQAVVLAAGVLVMLVVGLVPVLGGMAWFVVSVLSLGAVVRSRFGTRQLGPVPM